jgi:thiol-disulfide isomerase/thioredoxin
LTSSLSLLYIILISTVNVQAVSVVLPNNLSLPTYKLGFVNFNDLNTGYTVLNFIMPKCGACKEFIPWLNDIKNSYDNINFYMVTKEDSPSIAKYRFEINSEIPIIIDENNTLGTLLEVKRAPSLYIFKDGKFITKRTWPIEGGKEELQNLFKDVSQNKILPQMKKENFFSGMVFPNITGETLYKSMIKTHKMKWPSFIFVVNLNCKPCRNMMNEINEIKENLKLPNIYFIVENKKEKITEDPIIKQFSNEKNIHFIIDSNKEINNKIRKNINLSGTPFIMFVDNDQEIKWAKLGYNSNDFKNTVSKIINSWISNDN